MKTAIPYNTFTPRERKPSPMLITSNLSTKRIEIWPTLEDLPPRFYLSKREADLLKLGHPKGRKLEGGKYVQLWTETLRKGDKYVSFGEPEILKIVREITLKEISTECLTIPVPRGYYPTGEKLVEALNLETSNPLANWDKSEETGGKKACGYRFAYNKSENRIMLGLTRYTDLTFNDNLHTLLGFTEKHYKERRQTAENPPLMNRGIYNIYVYCSLCAPVRVGSVLVPLLRTIDVPSGQEWGRVACTRFNRPMYIPVNMSSFNSITIDLYDDTGRPIFFKEGRTVLTLHLRPRKK